ncbi:putative transporter [Colletotrichum orbiculare MAFF 240422]|uniref:Transporter n=1 Tax=Colletotrichum orbiculare (strain 104-T / ATCC 96160 / CBS 514.97 / LARS 414 / MAFF 240422) TaxID=1213857 RepID=A0A484FQA9_COLOR|nr:putative transporter [Colletotrichum orbiculare MAFF 240422]
MDSKIVAADLAKAHFEAANIEDKPTHDPDGNGPRVMDPAHRAAVEKSMKRKLDMRCSLFVLIYIMNYLDRNNIAAARLRGLQDDLKLDYNEYATCLSILYVGYILMQIPSNMIINKISRPSWYIAAAMLIWGLISTLSGVTTSFGGMVATRFFLGFIEAAFLPGALLILSKWYTRRELTQRNAILFCGNLISNAFSALIGAGVLSNMQGVLGHSAWRWLFWIEGAITMAVAISAAFILPDLPTNSRGFTEEELYVARLRMTEDVGEADADADGMGAFDGLFMAVKDVKIYVMMLTFTAYVVGLSFNAFFPTLTQTLGFGYVPTLLMSSPPWAFSCLVSLVNAWHADRTQERFWHIVGPICVGLVGFVICMSTSNIAARYVALFLQASSYAGFIVFYSWISSSFPRPPAKRAVAIAMINAFSQLGNVAGSYVWNLSDNGFRKSYGIVTAMFGVTIVGCYLFKLILDNLNRKLEAGEREWEVQGGDGAAAQQTADAAPDAPHKLGKGFRASFTSAPRPVRRHRGSWAKYPVRVQNRGLLYGYGRVEIVFILLEGRRTKLLTLKPSQPARHTTYETTAHVHRGSNKLRRFPVRPPCPVPRPRGVSSIITFAIPPAACTKHQGCGTTADQQVSAPLRTRHDTWHSPTSWVLQSSRPVAEARQSAEARAAAAMHAACGAMRDMTRQRRI